jgi:hypothetical protein
MHVLVHIGIHPVQASDQDAEIITARDIKIKMKALLRDLSSGLLDRKSVV